MREKRGTKKHARRKEKKEEQRKRKVGRTERTETESRVDCKSNRCRRLASKQASSSCKPVPHPCSRFHPLSLSLSLFLPSSFLSLGLFFSHLASRSFPLALHRRDYPRADPSEIAKMFNGVNSPENTRRPTSPRSTTLKMSFSSISFALTSRACLSRAFSCLVRIFL